MEMRNLSVKKITAGLAQMLFWAVFHLSVSAQSHDLRIDFVGDQPTSVQVGAYFAIQAEVLSVDGNGTVQMFRQVKR